QEWRGAPVSKDRAPGILCHLPVAQIHMVCRASSSVLHACCAERLTRRADAKSV
ncbi:hypothetical protein A2U01_0103484, partial [Trifolium medium]|nr:hypothetical protein [Trifolium medium]